MAVTPNYSWPIPVATDYVKDGYDAIADLGNAIDTTVAGLPSGALTLVSTQNPSASTGVNFTGLTVGKRYRLMSNLIGSSNNVELHIRYRENSTDKASGYYGAGWGVVYTGGSESYTLNNNTKIWVLTLNTAKYNISSLDIYLASASQAYLLGQVWDENTSKSWYIAGTNIGMSAVNGLSIYPASGNFTGKISLYEYE